ncbi:hypothetical protein NL676_035599 [Syzygium grande]|nr:hypothetical protein NL676_035599 [Syzygium grande]
MAAVSAKADRRSRCLASERHRTCSVRLRDALGCNDNAIWRHWLADAGSISSTPRPDFHNSQAGRKLFS